MYPGTIYGDYTDDFVRMSLTTHRIPEAMSRMKAVVDSIRHDALTGAQV
jgi:hypothetical protein